MIRGWIKFWRKLLDNEVFHDPNAYKVFTYLLLTVDKKTGMKKTARSWAAPELRMNGNTFYKALKRLETKYKIITILVTPKYSIISLINWKKYQDGNISVTSREHLGNSSVTIYNNKEERIKNNIPVAPQQVPFKRLPLEKQQAVHRLGYFLEDTLETTIVNWGKQAKAVTQMLKAGYTEDQIKNVIKHMAKVDDFFSDKGFDLMTVAGQISRYKAEATRKK